MAMASPSRGKEHRAPRVWEKEYDPRAGTPQINPKSIARNTALVLSRTPSFESTLEM